MAKKLHPIKTATAPRHFAFNRKRCGIESSAIMGKLGVVTVAVVVVVICIAELSTDLDFTDLPYASQAVDVKGMDRRLTQETGTLGNGGPHRAAVSPAPAPAPSHHVSLDCGVMCKRRCSMHSRPNLCNRACGTCCLRCKCVPPGTSGNREMCGRCYTDMTTHKNKTKCP